MDDKDKIIIGLPGPIGPLRDITGRLIPDDEIIYDDVNYGVVAIDSAVEGNDG